MEMNQEARLAWNIIENTNANLFLTGKAGTGKTTFLKELREHSPKRMIVLAPTGIAAINAGGVTIHSFFQLPLSPYLPGTSFGGAGKNHFQFSKLKRNIIRTLDLLVIDEISMVRCDLLDAIDSVMRRYRRHNLPFGGVQLLMIGDLQQLAPVVTPEDEQLLNRYYGTPYFFSSRALQQAQYLTVELKTVYRQQDERFIHLLNQIRENKATDATLQELNSRYVPNFKPSKDSDYIHLTTHNYPAQQINEQELDALPSKAFHFKAEVEGTFPESSYPADFDLVLKPGAQVMFIKNDPDHRFYNGMIGEVMDITEDSIIVRSKDTHESFTLSPVEWTNAKYTLNEKSKEIEEKVEGVFRQYPLRLAWAITIHKSQGLTFEHAIIDASHSFTHGQTYVALSRCKSLEGMVLSAPLNRRAIISDRTIDDFNHSMTQPTGDQLSLLATNCVIQTIDELFSFKDLEESYKMLLRTLIEHFSHRYPKIVDEYRQQQALFDELGTVAERFKQQYGRMLQEDGSVMNPLLQERIHKAAEFFALKMKPLVRLLPKTNVATDSKVAKQQITDRLSTFKEEIELKQQLLHYEQTADFTVKDYRTRKSQILLDANGTADPYSSRPKKLAKEPKAPKIPTRKISLGLYEQGKSVEEIAKERNLAVGTIVGHLIPYMVEGRINRRNFISVEHEKTLIDYLKKHPEISSTTEVRTALGDTYSYEEIRLVMALAVK